METLHDLSTLRQKINALKNQGSSIALVPTMGNLHDGHLSLLQHACTIADCSVVSIFVNPIQFGRGEDYERYASTLEEDSRKLIDNGLDVLFAPDLNQLYPGGIDTDTRVTVPEISNILCGQHRPGHFSGVTTVVTKLLINIQPDFALFGEKDYQQLLIIKRMVKDLCMPVEIIGMPIVREPDGLAMSSRNSYLNAEQRKKAPIIYQTLQIAAGRLVHDVDDFLSIEAEGMKSLENAGFRPEYVSIRNTSDLNEPAAGERRLSILVAAWLGSARLIDNIKISLD